MLGLGAGLAPHISTFLNIFLMGGDSDHATRTETKTLLWPYTGAFTGLRHRWLDKVGKRADSFEIDKGGYIGSDDKKYRTNRLAFLYMTGEIPMKVGFKDNNIENVRWDNLVIVTDNAAASYKAKRSRNNTSGYKGVS